MLSVGGFSLPRLEPLEHSEAQRDIKAYGLASQDEATEPTSYCSIRKRR